MHGEVAAVAEDDRVHVLALGVVADRARRVVRGQRAVRLRQALRLFHSHECLCDWGERGQRTSWNISFSSRSMMISKSSQLTESSCCALRSMFTSRSHSSSAMDREHLQRDHVEEERRTLLVHVILDLSVELAL
jgi:hypothetical protein